VGDARHFTVWVDDRHKRAVELPCWHDLRLDKVTVVAPPPGYDGGTFVVDEGVHAVRVVDDDTGQQDYERFSVPHVELEGSGFTVGNHVDVWVNASSVSVRGPTALRGPRL
jgi:hypothetical protein